MVTAIRIDVSPHPGQAQVHHSRARFKCLAAGRRWGKTRLGVNECLDIASRGGRSWWVAPSYRMSEVGWRPVRQIGAQIGAEIRRADRQIILPGGGEVSVRSADNPDSLRGEGLDFVVIDECAFVREEAWTEALRPALSDRLGLALFISTPKGRNWFWRVWQRGQSDAEDWASWRFPTVSNPFIEESEIEAARLGLPERIFRQEYLAEFIEDSGSVFRHVIDAATATGQKVQDGRRYIVGVDWGKHNDYTVITVMDASGPYPVEVFKDRFNQIDYTVQMGRLQAICEQYKPQTIIAEQNSMGDPLIEQLQRAGLPVRPFQTTNASKAQIIDGLSLAFERGEIEILADPVTIGELQAYEMERLPSGTFRYSAPSGMHDDTVMSLAFAHYGATVAQGIQSMSLSDFMRSRNG